VGSGDNIHNIFDNLEEFTGLKEPPRPFLNFPHINAARDVIERHFKNASLDAYADDLINAAAFIKNEDIAEFERLCNRMKDAGVSRDRWRSAAGEVCRKEQTRVRELAKAEKKPKKTAIVAAPAWPEPEAIAAEVQSGDLLIADLVALIRQFIVLDGYKALAVALWIMNTWIFPYVAETNPYLRIVSPDKNCGKTTLLKLIWRLARSGWLVPTMTPAVFVRTLMRDHRTILVDEADALFHDNENLRGVLDSANDPDTANVPLNISADGDWTPVEVNVFVPIALCGIGGFMGKMKTLESRSIRIELQRATAAERKSLTKARQKWLKEAAAPFLPRLARWAKDNAHLLAVPAFPGNMDAREEDKWEPLIKISDHIGGVIAEQARTAMLKITGTRSDADQSAAVQLLEDLKTLFDERHAEELGSADICEWLAQKDARPWAEFSRGRPITQNGLARLLRPYKITSGSVHPYGSTIKGYKRKEFEEAWERYLSPPIPENKNPPETEEFSGNHDLKRASAQALGAVREDAISASAQGNLPRISESGVSLHGEKDLSACAHGADDSRDDESEGIDREHFEL
jgi:hypothetical protein